MMQSMRVHRLPLQLNLPFHKIKKISDLKRLEGLIDRRLAHEGVVFGDRPPASR